MSNTFTPERIAELRKVYSTEAVGDMGDTAPHPACYDLEEALSEIERLQSELATAKAEGFREAIEIAAVYFEVKAKEYAAGKIGRVYTAVAEAIRSLPLTNSDTNA